VRSGLTIEIAVAQHDVGIGSVCAHFSHNERQIARSKDGDLITHRRRMRGEPHTPSPGGEKAFVKREITNPGSPVTQSLSFSLTPRLLGYTHNLPNRMVPEERKVMNSEALVPES